MASRPQSLYDDDDTLQAVLALSLVTAEQDDKKRRQKYGDHTPITARSQGGSPINTKFSIARTPTVDNTLSVATSASKSGPPSPSIARPRPDSRRLAINQPRCDSTSSTSAGSVPAKDKPVVPPRPAGYPQKPLTSGDEVAPPLPTFGPNSGRSSLTETRHHASHSAHGGHVSLDMLDTGHTTDLISLSPRGHSHQEILDFDLSSLDPLSNSYKHSDATAGGKQNSFHQCDGPLTVNMSQAPKPQPLTSASSMPPPNNTLTTPGSYTLRDRNPSPMFDMTRQPLASSAMLPRPESLPSGLSNILPAYSGGVATSQHPAGCPTCNTQTLPTATRVATPGHMKHDVLSAYPQVFPPVDAAQLTQQRAESSSGLGTTSRTSVSNMQMMPNQFYAGGIGAALPISPYFASSALVPYQPDNVAGFEGNTVDNPMLPNSHSQSAEAAGGSGVFEESLRLPSALIPTPVSNEPKELTHMPLGSTASSLSMVNQTSGSSSSDQGALARDMPPRFEHQMSQQSDDLMYFASDYQSIHDYLTLECFDPFFTSQFPKSKQKHLDSALTSTNTASATQPVTSISRDNVYDEINDADLESITTGNDSAQGLRDPFSVDDLAQELRKLEDKRRKYAEEQEELRAQEAAREEEAAKERERQHTVQRREKPARPPKPAAITRRLSCMAKDQEFIYELLQPCPENTDAEVHSFCQMVTRLREEHNSNNMITNKGFVVSPRVSHAIQRDLSVKLIVTVPILDEPMVFTSNLNSAIDHVISQVLLSLTDEDTTQGSAQLQYVLQVTGLAEYLINDTMLGEYAYVQNCLKVDKDIRLSLVNITELKSSLQRMPDDDNQLVFVPRSMMSDELVKRDTVNILLETFYSEVEKLRDTAISHGINRASPMAVLQSVKAICSMLYKISSVDIIKACYRLQAFTVGNRLTSASLQDREAFVFVTEDGNAVPVVETEKSATMNDLHVTLEHLTIAVKSMVDLYCRTFHTDYRFMSSICDNKEPRMLDSIQENLIVHIASCHRMPDKWRMQYIDYRVIAGVYHGGRSLCPEVVTSVKPQQAEFVHNTLIWDEWVMFDNLFLNELPREARLCFTLIGVKVVNSNQHGSGSGQQRLSTPLGWVALQLFNHKFELVQGSQLLGLWGAEVTQPTGTSQSNTDTHNSILLQIHLPDFDGPVPFPNIPRLDLVCQQEFKHLHPADQDYLNAIVHRDVLTRLSRDELDAIWQRRHFLLDNQSALSKVLLSVPSWAPTALVEVYSLLDMWTPLTPLQAIQLLLPGYADTEVRNFAVQWLGAFSSDEMADFLPQFVQALKFESYHTSALVQLLLERAASNIRFAHQLYWLLKEAAEDIHYRKRYQLVLGALLSVVGQAVRREFSKQEDLSKMLSAIAEKVKAAKDKEGVLHTELSNMWDFLPSESIRLPINPSMEIVGTDIKSCSFFPSNAFPLKLVFHNADPRAEPVYSMFKVGDDLRQDMLTMQLISIMDRLWLSEGLDLRIVTFKCQATGFKKGLVELVTESETLRKIQVKQGHGIAGSFKDRPIAKWLQMQNATELDYQKAVGNFTCSCAGYCVATYILGIMDRHNDNIMVKQSGHLFHIDFGKFLGDSQMFGSIKRDRVPFVLTSDMVYVINGGDKPTHQFQHFVDLCCKAFNIMRKYADLFLTIFSMMIRSGIPGVSASAAHYVQKALMRDRSDIEATAEFTALINHSMKSFSTQLNFFFHNLAQMKFSGHSEGVLLSFIPKTYTMQTDGRITSVEVFGYQKRYNPEKYYIYIIKVKRESQKVDSFIFRRYSEVQEFQQKLMLQFSLPHLPPLSDKVHLGRTHVQSVAEVRKAEIERFLNLLLRLSDEVSESDLVYTFFHPMLRDEQDIDKTNLQKLKEKPVVHTHTLEVQGALKLSVFYKNGVLTVMVMHASQLAQLGEPPDPYVKAYLLPDPLKVTKRKTKIAKATPHPTYNEMLQYRMRLDEVQKRVLQLTVWNYHALQENQFLGAVYLPLDSVHLNSEEGNWFQLQRLQDHL